MTELGIKNLAGQWLQEQRQWREHSEKDENPPAIDAVIQLGYGDPEILWELILALCSEQDLEQDLIGMIGCGPLEDLIADHGRVYYDRIQAEAKKNPVLMIALGHVWISESLGSFVEKFERLGCQLVSIKH